MKQQLMIFLSLFMLLSCSNNGDNDVFEQDIQKIEQYIADNNLDASKTEEGVYYIISRDGDGEHPTTSTPVTVHYAGYYLEDGVKFDSSYDRGQPSTFSLNQVIEGWKIGIPKLERGGKGTLLIPSKLAYGANPPQGFRKNAILRFEVELLDF